MTSSHASVWRQLSGSPRLWLLMVALLPSAIWIGATAVVRLQYATEAFGNELGVGVLTLFIAVFAGALGPWSGVLADSVDARPLLVVVIVLLSLISLGEWAVGTLAGPMPRWSLLVFVPLTALVAAAGPPAIARVQASLVPPEARGSAEVANVLRLGLGSVGGSVGAAIINDFGVTSLVCAALAALGAVAVLLVARPVPPTPTTSGSRGHGLRQLGRVVASDRALLAIVVADLALTLVLPTQLVSLGVVDRVIPNLTALALGTSLLGVLVGRLLLFRAGVAVNAARRLTLCMTAFAAICAASAVMATDDWLFGQPVPFAVLLFAGGAINGYTQGLTAALLQQQSPDEVRGRLTGAVSGARQLMIAVGIAVATVVILPGDTRVMLAVLAIASVVTILALRGFRGLPDRSGG